MDEAERKRIREENEWAMEMMLLEKMNQYLEENEEISKEIFDEFSHELRTPAVTIKAYIDMLLQGKFGELTEPQKEKLERIKENTELLIKVIFQMLEKSQKRKWLFLLKLNNLVEIHEKNSWWNDWNDEFGRPT